MSWKNSLLTVLLTAALVLTLAPSFTLAQSSSLPSTETLVLVNSESADYADFGQYIQPYLDHFGVPYTVLDVGTGAVGSEMGNYALIIVGHRQLDSDGLYLDETEEGYISAAVNAGTGLVNFDNDLSVGGTSPRYQFIQDIFDFGYLPPSAGSGVTFTSETGGGLQINCWEDAHQEPVLTTFTDATLFKDTDGEWDEFLWAGHRDYPGVFAGIPEASGGTLGTFHCFGDVPDGTYDVIANLYHSRNWRYYWGYTAADPRTHSYDVTTGPSGDFAEFEIDTITITDGSFDIYMNYAEDLGGTAFPYFGWSWIRLVPTSAPPPVMHYITERHAAGETISTGSMTMAGITLSEGATALAMTGSQPFLVAAEYGTGHAVQWGSYDWMSHSVKGPVYGLDDLVWRSIVWAARKPFAMQGLPPFLTMRVDDESGPFWWIHIANEFGIKPWAGLFYHNVDATEAADLSSLVHAGQATASVHAKSGTFFYYNHGIGDFSDEIIAANYAEATAWHETYDIPIAKFVLPHYYEFGTNVFQGLSDWGVEFVGTMMDPGNGYGAPWIMNGPYRLYETGSSSGGRPVYYADFMTIPGHPEFDGQFFNCVTEIRDDAGYEWYPSSDVPGTIGRGTRQSIRALDSMALATLFTHGYFLGSIGQDNWRAILQGITDNLAEYEPIYVTLDHACQYVRAMHTSDIATGTYDAAEREVTVEMSGETDMPTMLYLFTEQAGDIQQTLIDVPTFSGSATVNYTLAGPLDHIVVSPASATVATGSTQQFTAQGYDADGNPIPNLPFSWTVTGGGTIDGDGLFTAGLTPGSWQVEAAFGGVSGTASVEVVAPALDHFTFEPIASPQYAGAPFPVTITARDVSGNRLAGYFGTAALTDSTGTVAPATTGSFDGGVWTGEVTVGQVAHDVTLTATDGGAGGTSEPFEVLAMPMFYGVTSPAYEYLAGEAFPVTVTAYQGTTVNLWEDDHQDPVLATTSDWTLLETTPGEWTEFYYSSRPFPSVMAAHDEYDKYGLPLMHFFAGGIPNGEYEVIANLYDNSPMRYFYGFTESTALDNWVDGAGGAGGTQHREYSLGTVSITDGSFDLYVQDADILGGTYPIFGWAWVRLVPVESDDLVVDCSDDAHQEPVLATTTLAADLNQTDGQWTEFLYTPSRPYPSILAAVNEYELSGLPVMRFYSSGIPNGEYEVLANLYDNAAMRYFYGFAPDDPKAQYVDTPGGATGTQHREYSLGTVSITDGTFDLYVQDADLAVAGTYPFFGWAWIRLAPAGPLMTSSSPTMLFDGDGDGVFGEPGDNVKPLVDGSLTIMARDTVAGSDVEIRATDTSGRFGYNTYAILPVNEPPVANDDTVETDEDVPVTFNVLDNDTDPDGNLADATAAVTAGPDHGTVAGTYGSFTYSPDADFYGSDSFVYEVCDTEGLCDTAIVYVTVHPVNDDPVAVDDDYAVTEDVPLTVAAPGVLENDSDVDEDTLSVGNYTAASHGTLALAEDGSFTYTPDPDYCGSDSATYTVADGNEGTATAAINFAVECVNDPPELSVSPESQTVQYGDAIAEVTFTATDVDSLGDELTAAAGGVPAALLLSEKSCADGGAGTTCTWTLSGAVDVPAETYTVELTVSNGELEAAISTEIVVVEEAMLLAVGGASVQYSDSVELSATLTDDDGVPLEGKILNFDVSDACSGTGTTGADGTTTFLCSEVPLAAGSYAIEVTFEGEAGYYQATTGTGTLAVMAEDARVRFDDENPVAVRVAEDGGASGPFTLTFYVREAYDVDLAVEPNGEPLAAPGDIALVQASLTLVPVGPGSPVVGACTAGAVTDSGYAARLPVTCSFQDVPVNTYTAVATVDGGYYAGLGEDVLTVYDPSLGFASGGGWFYWPGTQEKTNFGFTMKYNKKGSNIQGSLLLVRHVGDEAIYRVKSNALYGLALGIQDEFGWASFSGKSTYLEPGWPEPIGNYEFVVYVEDRNEPGTGIDRFWIEVHDKDGLVVNVMSIERDAPTEAVEIGGGNIVVPH